MPAVPVGLPPMAHPGARGRKTLSLDARGPRMQPLNGPCRRMRVSVTGTGTSGMHNDQGAADRPGGTGARVSLTIRPAEPPDSTLIFTLIGELAAYENLTHEVRAVEADIHAILFGPAPRAFCEIAELEETPVGFALWFYNVSTFEGR